MERMLEELKQTVMDQIVDYMWELYEKDLKWWKEQQENFKIYGSHAMMECVKDGVISVEYMRTVMMTKQEATALFKKQMKERVLELDLQIREKVGTVIAYEFNRNNCNGFDCMLYGSEAVYKLTVVGISGLKLQRFKYWTLFEKKRDC